MNAQRFDRLAAALATGASRRRAVRALLGGLAALGTGALGRAPAGAKTDRSCKRKPAIDNQRCPPEDAMEEGMGTGGPETGIPGQCTDNPACFCAITVAGDKRCVNLGGDEKCPNRDQCDSGEDCRRGEVCIKVGGCCGNRRFNLCVRRCR
jgi:hypothetical protein